MAEPKQKQSKGKTRRRRSQIQLKKVQLVECKSCKKKTRAHRKCEHCDAYPKQKE